MKNFKFHLSTIILLALLTVCLLYRTEIVTFVMGNITEYTKVNKPDDNPYTKKFDFEFVQNTNDFHVKDKQGILNVIYTILNSGKNSYTFYCSTDYDNCSKDLKEISENQILLSTINNMVSPYNSYQKLYVTTNSYGKSTITLDKLYSDEDIQSINTKIKEIKSQIIKDGMTNEEKIKAIHDYIINNSVYDEERAAQIENGDDTDYKYNSHKANGPLLEGKALCSGYSDAMKLFLDDLGIKNYKIANKNHIWNLVYLDGKWLHIDLTWDDPVTSDRSNMLLHKFFLINTDELLKLDNTNHGFNKDYYLELK